MAFSLKMKPRPKYHKIGLYGGAPTPPLTIDNVDGTTSSKNNENTAMESDINVSNASAASVAMQDDEAAMVTSGENFSTGMTTAASGDGSEKNTSANESTAAVGYSDTGNIDGMDVDCIDYDPTGGNDDNQSSIQHHDSDSMLHSATTKSLSDSGNNDESINTLADIATGRPITTATTSVTSATTSTVSDEGVKVVFSNKLSVIKAVTNDSGGTETSPTTAMDTSHIDTLVSTALSESTLKSTTNVSSDELPINKMPVLQKGSIMHKRTTDFDSSNSDPNSTSDNSSEIWHTVGIFKDLTHKVTNYIDSKEWNPSMVDPITTNNIPDLTNFSRVSLEPGTAYRFRLRAINSCGIGLPGESASFKTCLPGFPGAPSSIKISKSPNGAHLTWEPPPSTQGEILEYTVYLAIKSPGKQKNATPPSQLAFVRVYSGSNNQCTVLNSSLSSAHVDYTSKPAIIFRIAARNSKGYGPATQVRWLQDASVKVGANAGSPALAMTGGAGGNATPTGKGIKRKL